jgi:hypothetical protein
VLIRRHSRHRGLQFGSGVGTKIQQESDLGSFKINLRRSNRVTELDEIEDNYLEEESSSHEFHSKDSSRSTSKSKDTLICNMIQG